MPCFLLPLAGLVAVLFLWGFDHYYQGPQAGLERWAKTEGLRIVSAERRSFVRGPFFLAKTNLQAVYRVAVQDEKGRRRTGWVRVGNFWGTSWDRVEARWDGTATPRPAPAVPADDPTPMWDRELDA